MIHSVGIRCSRDESVVSEARMNIAANENIRLYGSSGTASRNGR